MKTAIISLTAGGTALAKDLVKELGAIFLERENYKIAEILRENWHKYDAFICVMATGIVVRAIAPLLRDKAVDPCVVVLDEKGGNVISLLSGHLGGGNELTLKIAERIGANPVITTASDTLKLAALDLWAKQNSLVPPIRQILTKLSARLVNKRQLSLYTDIKVKSLPPGLFQTEDFRHADFIVSNSNQDWQDLPVFIPKNVVIGTGCNRGTPIDEFEQALAEFCAELGIMKTGIRNLASIDAKKDETGLLEFAERNNWTIDFYNKQTINTLKHLEISTAAMKAVGAIGVAEPTCLLSAASDILLSRKRKWKNVTMAAALVPFTLSAQGQEARRI